jgi:hypothetical protein
MLLKGNAPSNLGHDLTNENTQMHEEWTRQHADLLVPTTYQVGDEPTTNDAMDTDIFFCFVPSQVAAAVVAVSTSAPTSVPTSAPTSAPNAAVPNAAVPSTVPTASIDH